MCVPWRKGEEDECHQSLNNGPLNQKGFHTRFAPLVATTKGFCHSPRPQSSTQSGVDGPFFSPSSSYSSGGISRGENKIETDAT